MEKKSHSLVKSGLALSMATLLSRVLGLVREMTKAAFLGTGREADAFGIAFQLPNLFRRLFAENSVSVAFIPTFRASAEDPLAKEETQRFVSSTLTLVTLLTAAVSLAGIMFAPLIVKIFYGSADAETLPEAVVLSRVMFPYLVLVSVAALFQGILNGMNVFAPSGFAPALFNAVVIAATYALAPRMKNAARAMAVGVVAGGFAQALFQLPFALKTGWRVSLASPREAFSNPLTRRVVSLVLPTVVGMAAYQVNDIVSSALAKRAGVGVYSSLQYSLRLQELVLGIFAVSIGSVILPDLSALARKKSWGEFEALLLRALKVVTLIALPVTFYSLVSGREIVSLVYKTRSFTDESARMTLSVFRFHMAGLLFIALNRILSPAFYAQSCTVIPTAAGLANFAVNIALAALLVRPMGGEGIALALSAASLANTLFLFFAMPRLRSISARAVALPFALYAAKIALFSALAAVPARIVRSRAVEFFAGRGRLASFGAPVALTAAVFACAGVALLLLTRDELAMGVASGLRRRRASP